MYLTNPRKRKKNRARSRKRRTVRAVAKVAAPVRRRRKRSRRRNRNRAVSVRRGSGMKIFKARYAINPRRRRRSSYRRNPSGMILGLVSKSDIMVAAGAVGAGVLTSQVMTRFGSFLPGAANPWGAMAYRAGLPIAGAWLIKKYSPDLAKGFVIGGIVTAINDVLTLTLSGGAVASTGAYLGAPPRVSRSGSYDAINNFGATPQMGGSSVYQSSGAFGGDAWAN